MVRTVFGIVLALTVVSCGSENNSITRTSLAKSAGTFVIRCYYPDEYYCVNYFSDKNGAGIESPDTFCTPFETAGTYSTFTQCPQTDSLGSCFTIMDKNEHGVVVTIEEIYYHGGAATSAEAKAVCEEDPASTFIK
jgi:hypothetical protein